MEFWLAALALVLIVAAWLARPLLSARTAAAPRAAHDMQVFRDQLSSVDRDLARGVLAESEAEGARAEISRRLLAAATEAERQRPADPAPARISRLTAAALVAALVAGGGGLYLYLGAPGAQDRPLAARLADLRAEAEAPRLSQAEAEARAAEARGAPASTSPSAVPAQDEIRMRELVAQLREALATRPDDLRGRRLLADSLLRLGDAVEARAAMQEVVEMQGDAAPAADHTALAETMILAAGGYVSADAGEQLAQALRASPDDPIARYYAGLALAQSGQREAALALWSRLVAESAADAPWVPLAREGIVALGGQAPAPGSGAGSDPALPGPSAQDVENAGTLSAEDRAAMIEGMVGNLSERLRDEGGSPEEWARLIRAYGVLGRPDDARETLEAALAAHGDAPAARALLEEAGRAAGIAP